MRSQRTLESSVAGARSLLGRATQRPARILRSLRDGGAADLLVAWRLFKIGDGSSSQGVVRLAGRALEFGRYMRSPADSSADPCWLFSSEYFLAAQPEVRAAGTNPLMHYVRHWQTCRVEPHPLFDSAYYLSARPDVVASGMNPLLHYLRHGQREARGPNPWFSHAFYRDRLPSSARPWRDQPVLHYLRHGTHSGLDPHPAFRTDNYRAAYGGSEDLGLDALSHFITSGRAGRLAPYQRHLERWAPSDERRPAVALVTHHMGGGTQTHVGQIVELLDPIARPFLLSATGGRTTAGHFCIAMHAAREEPGVALVVDPAADQDLLVELLRMVGVVRVHVHHWIGLEEQLPGLLKASGLPYDVTLHDHFALAPDPHLSDERGRFIEPTEAATASLTRNSQIGSLAQWRERSGALLTGAVRVIAPSVDTASRIGRYLPDLTVITASHPDAERAGRAVEPRLLDEVEPLRVVVLGHLVPHKGAHVVMGTAGLADEQDLPIELHVLGRTPKPQVEEPVRMVRHGPYTVEALPDLLEAISPHLAWFPSTVPETFSYTLSEAMEARLPILASDLGALPERLGGRAWTWLVPWDSSAEELCAQLIRIRTSLMRAEPPPPPPTLPTARSGFYEHEYLATLLESGAEMPGSAERERLDER